MLDIVNRQLMTNVLSRLAPSYSELACRHLEVADGLRTVGRVVVDRTAGFDRLTFVDIV